MAGLSFPSHFPPSDRWKKFFIGVRWLGPDLSFFKRLKVEQAERNSDCMHEWGGGRREELARAISKVLSENLGWKSPYFLPNDMANVAFHGPSFDFCDPESALEGVIELLEEEFAIAPSEKFWQSHGETTFGALVDDSLALG